MSDSQRDASLTDLLARLESVVDELLVAATSTCTDDELLDALRSMERVRRKLDPADYRLINESTRRGLPDRFLCRTAGRFLRQLLTLDAGEANARVAAAEATGPRTALTGETLAPVFEHVAAAQAAGVVSQRQALLIERTVDSLPDAVAAESGEQVEKDLVAFAHRFDPAQLGKLARHMVDCLNPDGTFTEPAEQHRRRGLSFTMRPDGSSHGEFEATPELTARLQACLDVFAAPQPAVDGVKDARSLAQRQHDGLCAVLDLAQRSDAAPSNNGVAMTVVVTMTTEQYLTGHGLAQTSHGALVNAGDALSWAGGDYEVFTLAMNSMREITHHGDTHRIYSRNQRLALAARDRGCTFPGCPQPPGRCQTDHLVRHEHGGPTSLHNGALACHYHHREANRYGWTHTMINNRPHWIPPRWIDPHQTPQRNTLHDIPTHPAA